MKARKPKTLELSEVSKIGPVSSAASRLDHFLMDMPLPSGRSRRLKVASRGTERGQSRRGNPRPHLPTIETLTKLLAFNLAVVLSFSSCTDFCPPAASKEKAPHTLTLAVMAQPQGLTEEQLSFFNKNGYLLVPDAISQETVKELLADTNKMLNDFSLDDHPMTKFSTGGDDGADHVGDKYFLESGDKVRFFFEEGKELCSLLWACF